MEKAIERIPGLFSKWLYDAAQERIEMKRLEAEINRHKEEARAAAAAFFQKKEKKKQQALLFS